jgi:hypothetical protein
MRIEEYTSGNYFRKITYEGNVMVEWEDNWGNGEHYKLIDGQWKALKPYKPLVIIQRKRKHNTWDK